jgi:hypothetical protein
MQRDVRASSRTSGQDAVGVSDAARVYRADEHPDAHGEVVWSWRPGAGVKFAAALTRCADDGGNKPVSKEQLSFFRPVVGRVQGWR